MERFGAKKGGYIEVKSSNRGAMFKEVYKLQVNEQWQIEIPEELREKFQLKNNDWIDVGFGIDVRETEVYFDALLNTLIHDGILIDFLGDEEKKCESEL